MLIPSRALYRVLTNSSLSRRVNANSQQFGGMGLEHVKLIKKGEC